MMDERDRETLAVLALIALLAGISVLQSKAIRSLAVTVRDLRTEVEFVKIVRHERSEETP